MQGRNNSITEFDLRKMKKILIVQNTEKEIITIKTGKWLYKPLPHGADG